MQAFRGCHVFVSRSSCNGAFSFFYIFVEKRASALLSGVIVLLQFHCSTKNWRPSSSSPRAPVAWGGHVRQRHLAADFQTTSRSFSSHEAPRETGSLKDMNCRVFLFPLVTAGFCCRRRRRRRGHTMAPRHRCSAAREMSVKRAHILWPVFVIFSLIFCVFLDN